MLQSDLAVCTWIPLFPLRCEEGRRPELASRPTALLSPEDTRRVWIVSPVARRMGVKPGITVSQAIGLCPPLVLLEPDPVWYDEQFARLLLALSRVSPVIEPAELGRAFVGVDGLEGLYGGPERVLAEIAAAAAEAAGAAGEFAPVFCAAPAAGGGGGWGGCCREEGWGGVAAAVRLGWGRGKFTAWVAATRAKPGEFVIVADEHRLAFLASQPVAALPLDADTHRRLHQLRLKTLSDLTALPEAAVTSQFGRLGRLVWRLAAGLITDPVIGREVPEPITAALDFPTPIADRVILANALDQLVERALKSPRRTGWRVHTLRARAALEQGASWLIEITLKDPSADRHRLAAPLKVRLEQAPPTGAVERLAVEFTAFAPGTTELQLFARDAESAARAGRRQALRAAVHEIKTRLKRSTLYHVIEVHPWSRLPERRYALIDYEP
jgi:DNA polymerase-4/protein ImuB